MPDTTLQLLGSPCLLSPGAAPQPLNPTRPHQVLAVLGWLGSSGDAAPAQGWVSREWLAALMWPDRQGAQARANLRKVLLQLRQLHTRVALEEGPRGLRCQAGSDLAAFDAASLEARWLDAAQLGTGTPLQGLDEAASEPFTRWLHEQRRQHQQRWRNAAAQALAQATPEVAAELAEQLLRADPQDSAGLAYVRRQTTPQLSPLSVLVGREQELRELQLLLDRSRLVTVLGPGGVGKSRLARHAADAMAPGFVHGAALVVLDDLSTPGAVPARVADTLGLALPPHTDPAVALARALASRSMLLVLDGFEAVIDAAAAVPPLLAGAPGLRLLVTSRERLDIDGECCLPLAGLELPAAGDTAAQARLSPAVRLFDERARAVQPRFDLAGALQPVLDICRRVGGLPLAIEWAAAWMRVLGADELARDMADGATASASSGPAAVFESSWRLLTQAERQAYAALAVFRGGFDRKAASQVAGVELPMLAALVDKSMLRSSPDGRLDMHPLVHDHASSKLAQLDDAGEREQRHARHYLALLQQRQPLPPQENENVLAAWHHTVQQGDAAAVEAALTRIQWSALVNGRRHEAVALLGEAAQRFGPATVAGATLQSHQAWILLWLDEDTRAGSLAQAALQVLQAAGHAGGMSMCLRTLGHAARRACDARQAVQLFEQALALPQPEGTGHLQAALLDALGMALIQGGKHNKAREQVHRALLMNQTAGDEVQRMYNHFNLSQSHSTAGQPELALPWAQAGLVIGSRSGFPFFLPYLHAELARVLADLGRTDEARAQAAQALARANDTGDVAAHASAWMAQACVDLRLGDTTAARRAMHAAVRAGLGTGNRAIGALLLPVARRAWAGDSRAEAWAQLPAIQLLTAINADIHAELEPVELHGRSAR
ncbi:MAG: hypothetical protein Q7U99_18165 [Rubrivivax sp.]|nr:hypothetical protein [Rubrivivax sp.]